MRIYQNINFIMLAAYACVILVNRVTALRGSLRSSRRYSGRGIGGGGSGDAGLIAGCVVGGLAFIALVALAIYCYISKKKGTGCFSKSKTSPTNITEMQVQPAQNGTIIAAAPPYVQNDAYPLPGTTYSDPVYPPSTTTKY